MRAGRPECSEVHSSAGRAIITGCVVSAWRMACNGGLMAGGTGHDREGFAVDLEPEASLAGGSGEFQAFARVS